MTYPYQPPPPGGYPASPQPQQYQQPGYQQPPQQGYPPQPQPGYQQPPQPGYQQGYPPQPQQGYPPQGYQQPPQQPVPAGPPQSYAVDDQALAAQYKKAKEEMRGTGAGFFKVLGPQGQAKWDSSVPIGYEGSAFVHICGPLAPGKPLFATKKKYFWKSRSKPNGTSIIVPPGNDLIAQAVELASQNPDPVVQEFLKNFGKPRNNYLYNVLQLDNPQIHYGPDGIMRPLILDEGKQCHSRIGDVFDAAEGASNIVDYQRGRPVKLVRKKTGPRMMDIEWSAHAALNAAPLPEQFWPAIQNLWDLEKFVKYPTLEEMQAAILDMGLPMPGQPVQTQVPAGYPGAYNPGASPPYPNPYMAPEMAQQYVQPPPQQQPIPPQSFGPPPTQQQTPPQFSPPPVYSGQAQMPPQAAQATPPQSAPPPGLNPPPVSSGGPQQAPMGGPPPVPMNPPPQQQQAAPPPQQTSMGHPELSLPLAPGTQLEGERERCFGQFHPTDNLCIQCPVWIKGQCMRLSPQQQQPQQADGGLAALQQQLQGQRG